MCDSLGANMIFLWFPQSRQNGYKGIWIWLEIYYATKQTCPVGSSLDMVPFFGKSLVMNGHSLIFFYKFDNEYHRMWHSCPWLSVNPLDDGCNEPKILFFLVSDHYFLFH